MGRTMAPLRTRNQFSVKAHSTERTHVIPLYVHVRECDLAYFHEQQRKGAEIIQLLLTLLDGDSAFQALVHELDNVRMIDELIKTKSNTLFHITTLADMLQVQWQLQDHPHSLVNILQHSQRRRDENFVKKPATRDSPATEEERSIDIKRHRSHSALNDGVAGNQPRSTTTSSSFSPTTSGGSACRCGQSWSDTSVPHFCQLIEPDINLSPPSGNTAHKRAPTVVRAPKVSGATSSTTSCVLTSSSSKTQIDTAVTMTSTTGAPATSVVPSPPTAITGSVAAPRRGAVSENIQVFIRIRPLIDRETSQPQATATSSTGHSIRTVDDRTIEVRTSDATIKCSYDAVLDPSFSQDQVYERVRECTQSFLAGFNSTLFAYGQTGSGKSFTMFGSEGDVSRYKPGHYKSQAGIIPRAIKEIFEGIVQLGGEQQGVVLYCSFVQIYNEQIFDLLRDGSMASPLDIHEDRKNGIYVDGLSEYAVRTVNDCLALLQCGEQHRAVRSTHMNQVSSRSHSVFQLLLEQRRKDGTLVKSKFNLVDLAGSEKWNFGSDMQHFHISEMTNINLSLHTLGRCIAALSTKSASGPQHVPYRDSKLTRLLQDSLGGNTKTKIIATLSPSVDCIDESISTLKFADRAKQVMVTVRVNEQREIDPAYVEKLEDEIQRLKEIVRLLQTGGSIAASAGPESVDIDSNSVDDDAGGSDVTTARLRATLARVMQENMDLKEKQERQQHDIEQLRARLMGGPASSAVAASGGGQGFVSASENSLMQAKQQLESTLRHLKDASDRFFKFEIEEDELKSIHERVFKGVAGSAAMPSLPGSISKPRPPSLAKPSASLASPVGSQKQLAVDIQYRVRGRSSSQSARGASSGNNNSDLRCDTALSKQSLDPEKELELSRKAIEKQQKLQNWLLEKERRELLKLQQEHEYFEEHRRAQAERDAKFFRHAQAAKKKLLAAKGDTAGPESGT